MAPTLVPFAGLSISKREQTSLSSTLYVVVFLRCQTVRRLTFWRPIDQQNSEGIDVNGHHLYFVSKEFRTIFTLNLETSTYANETTRNGLFNGQPDQIERIHEVKEQTVATKNAELVAGKSELMYFTEDGGRLAGVHARNSRGQYLTILESSDYSDETTGLSFSPDGLHMYFAYQDDGVLFDVTREDGLPFHGQSLDVKFHKPDRKR